MQSWKRRSAALAVVGGLVPAWTAADPAQAALMFDQNVTPNVIMGTGIGNGSWTVDRSNDIELGLRGKTRHNAAGVPDGTYNSNGDGTYSFVAGVAPTQSFPTAVWSFEWSINSDLDSPPGSPLRMLDDLTYVLSIDTDPGAGTSFITFDPINDGNPGQGGLVFWDHSIGDNGTAQSGGAEAVSDVDYQNLIANNNVAQNSWKPHWCIPGFDPTVDGTYDFMLSASAIGAGKLASTSIQIIVGDGAKIPEPASLALFATGLLGLGWARRRRQRS